MLPPIWFALQQEQQKATQPNNQSAPWRPWEMQASTSTSAPGPITSEDPSAPPPPHHTMGQSHFLPGQLARAPVVFTPQPQLQCINYDTRHHHLRSKESARMCPDGEKDTRVTLYNPQERRKLSGNAAPFKRNLEAYLAMHPDWELYTGQDGGGSRKKRQRTADPKRKVEAVKQRKLEAQKPASAPQVSVDESDPPDSQPSRDSTMKQKAAQKAYSSSRACAEQDFKYSIKDPMSSLLWAIGQT